MVEQTLALFGGIALFNIAVCSPILIFSSVRRLLMKLPTENLVLNYFLAVGGYTALHSVALLAVVVATGGLEGTAALWGPGVVTGTVAVAVWAAASFILPARDWWNTREGEEIDGRIALGLGLIWYLVFTVVGLVVLTFLLIAFFFPG